MFREIIRPWRTSITIRYWRRNCECVFLASCLLPNLPSLAPQGAVHTTRLTNRTRLCASVSWGGLSALERTICAMPSASVAGIGRADAPPRFAARDFPALSNAEARPDKQNGAQHHTALPKAVQKGLPVSTVSRAWEIRPGWLQRQFGVCGAPRACWQNGAMTPNQVSRKTSCFASQLIENTRSRHETSDNFLRCAKTAPNSTSTQQSCQVEIDDPARVVVPSDHREPRDLSVMKSYPTMITGRNRCK